MALFLLPFTLRHQIVTQIAKAYQELACTGLKHWILLASTVLGGREFQDEMVHGNTCFLKFLVKRTWGVSVDFSLIGNAPAPGVDLRTPVLQLSWLINCWWKSWDIISSSCSQCPELDGREAGTFLLAVLAWAFADSQGAECLEDLL